MTNLDAITDDIRQVMEVQRNQPQPAADEQPKYEPYIMDGKIVGYTLKNSPPRFDLAAEVAKETKRALSSSSASDAADAQELSRYHDETMRLIGKYGMDAVVKVIVQCRNQALREGKL